MPAVQSRQLRSNTHSDVEDGPVTRSQGRGRGGGRGGGRGRGVGRGRGGGRGRGRKAGRGGGHASPHDLPEPQGPVHPHIHPHVAPVSTASLTNINNYIGRDGRSGYRLTEWKKDTSGHISLVGETRYYDQPPTRYDSPPPPDDPSIFRTTFTEILDEHTDSFKLMPHTHSFPAYSEPYGGQTQDHQGGRSTPFGDRDMGDQGGGSTPSGSDFSESRRSIVQKRRRVKEMGRECSDTEEDDMEDDEAFMDEAVPEAGLAGGDGTRTKQSKRSQRQRDGHRAEGGREDVDEEEEGDEDEVVGRGLPTAGTQAHVARGPWSNEAKQRVNDFGRRVIEDADEIARALNRSRHEVILRAGLGLKYNRAESPWVKYQTWYAVTHPKLDRKTAKEYRHEMCSAYIDLKDHMDPISSKAQWEKIETEYNEMIANSDLQLSVASRMRQARVQMANLATAFSRCHDLVVVGMIMNIGSDRAADGLTSFFAGSDEARELIDKYNVKLREFANEAMAIVKAKAITEGDGFFSGHFPTGTGVGTGGSAKKTGTAGTVVKYDARDNRRTQVSTTMLVLYKKIVPSACKVDWKGLQLHRGWRLLGWPYGVTPPGPGMVFKSLDKLALDSIYDCLPGISVERWTEEEQRLVRERKMGYGSIPLIVADNGVVLRRLRDLSRYSAGDDTPQVTKRRRKDVYLDIIEEDEGDILDSSRYTMAEGDDWMRPSKFGSGGQSSTLAGHHNGATPAGDSAPWVPSGGWPIHHSQPSQPQLPTLLQHQPPLHQHLSQPLPPQIPSQIPSQVQSQFTYPPRNSLMPSANVFPSQPSYHYPSQPLYQHSSGVPVTSGHHFMYASDAQYNELMKAVRETR